MISTRHIPSSHIKKTNGARADYIVREYPETESADQEFYEKEPGRRLSGSQKKYHHGEFNEWCMPEQSDGYIKAKRHGLL